MINQHIGPGRFADVGIAGSRDDRQRGFHQRDRGQLLRRQRRCDDVVRGVPVVEGREAGGHRRKVFGIDVGEPDSAGYRVQRGVAGPEPLGEAVAEGDEVGRNVEMESMVSAVGHRSRQVIRRQHVEEDRKVSDRCAVRQLDDEGLRRNRIERRNGQQFGVGVRELQREDVVDQLLCIVRNLGRGDEGDDAEAVDDGPRSGLIHRCDRLQRQLVEQKIFAGEAVGLDQNPERDRRRDAGRGKIEIDLDQDRGAANPHGGGRGLDFHVAVFGRRTRDERDGALYQRQERGVVRPVRVVDHLVQHHPRVRREAEDGAVDEGDAERGIRSGLDDVALVDVVAHVQGDRNAVTDGGRAAGDLGDVTDDQFRRGTAAGLGVFDLTGERRHGLAGKAGAIRRGQCSPALAAEVIAHEQFVAVL